MVSDGGTFESLVQAILYSENKNTILFGRPGKDSGQDARSDDGKVVYQAKYYQNMTIDDAVRISLKELKKIKNYQAPTHANHQHWKSVQRWVLVANFSINPNDHQKWKNDIVPLFKAEGLDAEYWDKSILEGKLVELHHIREVFFDGENRVLIGLREAHDLISNVKLGGDSMDHEIVGRSLELEMIRSFAKSESKVLEVTGHGGVGKTRLLYEGLVALANDGWRTFWALPSSMSQSSKWFHLLNGKQKTCIAIDNPEEIKLFQVIIEQLSTIERRNWKILVGLRTEKSPLLKTFHNHSFLHDPIKLNPLNETESKMLLRNYLGEGVLESWLHSIYTFTHGNPNWLCLIAELAKKNQLYKLPKNIDSIVELYINSCLNTMESSVRSQCLTLLRWLSLWGTLKIDKGNSEHGELDFLKSKEGLSPKTSQELLMKLNLVGLVKNIGINKRLYRIDSKMVQHYIISSWLLREEQGEYKVSENGEVLIQLLINQEVPDAKTVLETISNISIHRLEQNDSFMLMEPVFNYMEVKAREGNLYDQYQIFELVEATGASDPERALEVLESIRKNQKDDIELKVKLWGPLTLTHAKLISKLPWLLFQLADSVPNQNIARRYIKEFMFFCDIKSKDEFSPEKGKEAIQLLGRLLSERKYADGFIEPAYDLITSEMDNLTPTSGIETLLMSLLNPVRESIETSAKWTVSISKQALSPSGKEWELAKALREKTFKYIEKHDSPSIRAFLWRILNESHHAHHRAILHGGLPLEFISAYTDLLKDDLTRCYQILKSNPTLTIAEALAAREMWTWYLEFGPEDELRRITDQCENAYLQLEVSTWNFHDFFQWEVDVTTPAFQNIVATFMKAENSEDISEFFKKAKEYYKASRRYSVGINMGGFYKVVEACLDFFHVEASDNTHPVGSFVLDILKQNSVHGEEDIDWVFSVQMCQHYLRRLKNEAKESFESKFTTLFNLTGDKAGLIWALYGNPHPNITGTIFPCEIDYILNHADDLNDDKKFFILGVYGINNNDELLKKVNISLDHLYQINKERASHCLQNFIRSTSISQIRYKTIVSISFVSWVLELIQKYHMDGSILGDHDLARLKDQSGFRMNIKELTIFMRSRIDIEKSANRPEGWKSFPYKFNLREWVNFDMNNSEQRLAFNELCHFIFENTYTAICSLPLFVAQIDPKGEATKSFVEQYLKDHPHIDVENLSRLGYFASSHKDDSDSWATIATPIYKKTIDLNRKDRNSIYFSLSKKESGVYRSAPGEVPSIFHERLDQTRRMLENEEKNSPLYGYRQWAVDCAESDIKRETEWREEDNDE